MITESDIIFDNLAEDVFPLLEEAIDREAEHIMDEFNISPETMVKLIESWIEQANENSIPYTIDTKRRNV
jgi:hypothetical protein